LSKVNEKEKDLHAIQVSQNTLKDQNKRLNKDIKAKDKTIKELNGLLSQKD